VNGTLSATTAPFVGLAPAGVPDALSVVRCYHCGEVCADDRHARGERVFCCQGCLTVHELLSESGLERFYELRRHPGIRARASSTGSWAFLDDPRLQQQLLDFTDGVQSRVTFHIPSIHCIACVWLLENLYQLRNGIGRSEVNFPRREVAITFDAQRVRLSELVQLLSSIGYEPALNLGELGKQRAETGARRRWLQVGIAGFAFGNIMLFSIPQYFGLDGFTGPGLQAFFGWLSLALALPVVVFSASDYWKSAWLAVRQRVITLDVPIALGLAAIYAQSAFEIITGTGEGYCDSLTGLVFFLLCGRAFQQHAQERLSFDRDYRAFFPLSITRIHGGREECVPISDLRPGDRLLVRHREILPADARLVRGQALIDYSFVTGESDPVVRAEGDHLYAGGQQMGAAIEVETVKAVSEGYLASLWNHEAFRKTSGHDLNTVTNRYSRRFTATVISIAFTAAVFWTLSGDWGRGLKAFSSVLIVACPCALALAAPFALGTAQRWLARFNVFLKNVHVLERLARVNAIVFDKTGTLTAGTKTPEFQGEPLTAEEAAWIHAVARQSTHPHSARIAAGLSAHGRAVAVEDFSETPGCGVRARAHGHDVLLGSSRWLSACGVDVPETEAAGSVVHVAIDGRYRGAFLLTAKLRSDVRDLIRRLNGVYELSLLSGDNERERERFSALFGGKEHLHFEQSPEDKLRFIQRLQQSGRTVMMIGDGLNDAGALRQSDVGVAVVENIGTFSPASDLILDGAQVGRLPEILSLARRAVRTVYAGIGISAAYNVVGIGIAAAGILSPVVCAILMPLSSVSVVLFACGVAAWAARRVFSPVSKGGAA